RGTRRRTGTPCACAPPSCPARRHRGGVASGSRSRPAPAGSGRTAPAPARSADGSAGRSRRILEQAAKIAGEVALRVAREQRAQLGRRRHRINTVERRVADTAVIVELARELEREPAPFAHEPAG